MASNSYARTYGFYFGAFDGVFFPGIGNPTAYSNGCYNSGALLEDQWRYICLMNERWDNYPIHRNNYQLNNLEPYSDSGTLAFICTLNSGGTNVKQTPEKNVNATYTTGTAPKDWRDISLVDAVPLNTNTQGASAQQNFVYASLFNSFSESQELNQQNGDPTEHFHKLNIDKGDHNFALVTDPLELSPDALVTTLKLSVDNSASVDSVATPFIVLEYLIKI
jgi:hypothetical protein